MKKNYQKQIIDMLSTFAEALDYIQGNNSSLVTVEMIYNMKDGIESIYGFLNDRDIKDSNILCLLGRFNKVIKEIIENEEYNKSDLERLKIYLQEINNSIIKEFKTSKIKMVFLPYKADMWDSLESIYLAAVKDLECETYCVPIPYFTKNTDGLFEQLHYEGNEYPEYVKVIDWKEFDIEKIEPDVIFIHNPYDDKNLVTSVYPDYFVKNLSRFTDLLIYVPYFTSTRIHEDFCFNNGTVYSNKTIVLNEKEREIYIESFRKLESKFNIAKRFGELENKFLALGSPKFDKIFSSRKRDYFLPDEWKEIMLKKKNPNKKIVLYNTTLAEVLQFNELFLEKLKSVLEVLKKRDDIILWWRPHPLLVSTFESMRPELAEEYKLIVSDYINENWGIYDDSTDLHRAITWCDAYYGFGGSSVTFLFGATLKPVMVSHRCDIHSKIAAEHRFDEKINFFTNCLKNNLSKGLLNYTADNNLTGLFFDDSTPYDLSNYLYYITHINEYNTTNEWISLVKEAYKQLGVLSEKNSGVEIIKYLKNQFNIL